MPAGDHFNSHQRLIAHGYQRAAYGDYEPEDLPSDEYLPSAKEHINDTVTGLMTHHFDTVHDLISEGHEPNSIGVDLWLTRQGHGAGYWDGSYPEPHASRLTDYAKSLGEANISTGSEQEDPDDFRTIKFGINIEGHTRPPER